MRVLKKNNNKNAQQWENLMINKSYQKSTVNKKHLQNDNLQKFEKNEASKKGQKIKQVYKMLKNWVVGEGLS